MRILLFFIFVVNFGYSQQDFPLDKPVDFEEDSLLVYEIVEQQASFVGGTDQLKEWINQNLRYPATYAEICVQGTVYVSFIVEKNGAITDVKLLKGIDEELDKEAIKLIQSMPKWIAARHNGRVVRSIVRLPIKYSIS